ncbi:MAG: PTS sugar transporter subunit IIA [Rhodospirillaceae bacterium]|nr:MAG: PTS sugar transporter subunit IIA [Rhodospirillaceae bacterium]
MSNSLMRLISPQLVFAGVEAGNADEVIALLGNKLAEQGLVADTYVEAVIARESDMPTGLPLGEINVAVPHTDPEHVIAPTVAVATLTRPVPFGNMEDPDEKLPVSIVFLLALKEKDKQIEMLQAIVGLIQNGSLLEEMTAAADKEDILALLAKAA